MEETIQHITEKTKIASGEEISAPEQDPKEDKRKRRKQLGRDILWFFLKIFIIVAIVWSALTFLYGISTVSGETMYPRMRDGDLVVFYRLDKTYDIGDIITYRIDGKRYYSRVVAKGGDTVQLSETGELVVNGSIQIEEIFYSTFPVSGTEPIVLPPESVYVLGDYRIGAEATDSRTLGPLDCKTQTDGTVISLLRRRGL